MKKAILFLVLSSLLFSCNKTSQEKAEALVSKWMRENLKDPKSYEGVSFSKIDSTTMSLTAKKLVYESYPELIKMYRENLIGDSIGIASSEEAIEEYKKWGLYSKDFKEYNEITLRNHKDSYKSNLASLKRKINERDSILGLKEIYAYTLEHRYRAKNSFGALDVGEIVFYIDKDFSRIREVEQIIK
jgi:hypothetical protein